MKRRVKTYRISWGAELWLLLLSVSIVFGVAMVYFNNIKWALVCTPVALLVVRDLSKRRSERIKRFVLIQFRDFIQALNISLKNSSKTLLNCFDDAVKSMEEMYSGRSIFMKKLRKMHTNLHQNQSTRFDSELLRMANELSDDDVIAFASAVKECYGVNTSGISVVSEKYAMLIDQKRKVTEEIITMTRSQRAEQLLMLFVPVVMILFMQKIMGTYMDALYTTSVGRTTMAVGFGLNVGCYFLGNYFSKI